MAKTRRSRTAATSAAPGHLRIVAGRWRRRRLPVATVEGLRPTSERVRETLFNWLAARIDGARCLDLCAGTGALGFEALSRGAAHASLVENARPALAALRTAVSELQAEDAEIIAADAGRWLEEQPASPHDIVFIDPPYAAGLVAKLCRLLDERGWLAPNALVYIEHDRRQPPPTLPAHWSVHRENTAGNVRYLLLSVGASQ